MTRDHNDIYSIVERLRVLEEGLDKDQRKVNQLGPTFRPKTVAVLTSKTDPRNPMAGKLVGGSESAEQEESVLEADMAEDVLEKVKRSFTEFIKQAEESIDKEVQQKKSEDTDLKSKDKKDRGLRAKDHPSRHLRDPEDDQEDLPSDQAYQRGESPYDAHERQTEESELGSALSGVIPAQQPAGEPGVSMKESAAVKSMISEYGIMEIHGNERDGFEIRSGTRNLPTRFKNLDQAEMAIEMFLAKKKQQDLTQDYLEEE